MASPETIHTNVADWHAEKAVNAYACNDFDAYCRHIAIADRLRRGQ